MNKYWVFALLAIAICATQANWSPAVSAPNQNLVVEQQPDVSPGAVEYAQLSILAENRMTFEVGGNNLVPREFDLTGLYRSLGGRFRPTMVNLLHQLGLSGWRLVEVSQDRKVYTFVRG